jgi:cytochrome c oxidase assembly protein subunit 15
MKPTGFQLLSLGTVAAVYILIVLGGVVTSTGSGLACPDWPTCQGALIPPLTQSVLIEYTHRLWTVVVTALIVATMLAAWVKFRKPNRVTKFSTLTFILLIAQILLGMVTVLAGTPPADITAHLAVATLLFASAQATAMVSFMTEPSRSRIT